MTESLRPRDGVSSDTLAGDLRRIIEAVEGVQTLYPARPVWQNIAGAAYAAVTGEARNPVAVESSGDVVSVKARIGVADGHRAPDVARAAAAAVRAHLDPRRCSVEVAVVHIAG